MDNRVHVDTDKFQQLKDRVVVLTGESQPTLLNFNSYLTQIHQAAPTALEHAQSDISIKAAPKSFSVTLMRKLETV
jgi:hypothetical protein